MYRREFLKRAACGTAAVATAGFLVESIPVVPGVAATPEASGWTGIDFGTHVEAPCWFFHDGKWSTIVQRPSGGPICWQSSDRYNWRVMDLKEV